MQSVYYKNLGAARSAYDSLLGALRSRARSIPFSGSVDAKELTEAVLLENPELFYVGQSLRIMTSLMRKEIMPTYLYTPAQTSQISAELDAAVRNIISSEINEHQSDYDKVRALHDYLKSNIEYDSAAASSPIRNDSSFMEAHSVVGALLRHRCVCEGFAKAFKLLCDRVGLECWVVSGTGSSTISSGPHAWNIVRINGYYHHVDVTWDNQYSDSATIPNYGYMNLSDDEISKDHTWTRRNYPACPSSPYNYFKVNNALVDSRAQLENMLYNCMQMEEEIIMFRVVRGSMLEREINGCFSDCVTRASMRCKHISVSEYSYGGIPEQLTFFVKPKYNYK